MSQVCDICAKRPSTGHTVSNANNRTNRRWMPNLQLVRANLNGSVRRIKACTRCLRSGKVVKVA